jgi:hypothetical protein
MTEYENVKCQLQFKGCKGPAGYLRRRQFAQSGPWLDACENCARVPYEVPKQFQQTEPTAEPNTAEPNTAEPNTAEPNTAEPNTAEPNTTEPNTAEPNTSPTSKLIQCSVEGCKNQFPRSRGRYPQKFCLEHRSMPR